MSALRMTAGERWFNYANVILLGLLSASFLLPFLIVVSTSLISEEESIRRGAFILFPERIDFGAYGMLLNKGSIIFNAYQVTLFRVIVGTALNLLFTSALAYGLARKSLPGRNAIVTYIFITMVFGGGLIPTYMLIDKLGLKDTLWVLILPGLISAWNLFILRNFFLSIPDELEESAILDGATAPHILWKIIIPLSLPAMTTIGLFYAVGHWNTWFDASIYINRRELLPIQVILRNVLLTGTMQDQSADLLGETMPPAETLRSAVIVVSTLPILLVYPFIQKYFVKGALIGSIKG